MFFSHITVCFSVYTHMHGILVFFLQTQEPVVTGPDHWLVTAYRRQTLTHRAVCIVCFVQAGVKA